MGDRERERERDDLAVTLVWVAATGGVLTLGAAVFARLPTAASVGVGAILAVSNLWALGLLMRSIFRGRGGAGASLLAVLKMLALFVIVWLLLRLGAVDTLPLLVGYGALPIGIVAAALSGALGRP